MPPVCLSQVIACAGLVAAVAAPLGADAPTASLRITLTTAMGLPNAVRDGMIREVSGLWQRHGIRIDWAGPAAEPGGGTGIRVMVVSAAAGSPGRDRHGWPVAELQRDVHGQPVAIASVAAARRVIDTAGLADGPAAMVTHRLAVVLGRAVAHEIGHYLLNTASHARRGLMRASIDVGDLADLRDGGFGLDDDAALWARTSLTREAADPWRLAPFVYAR